MKTKLTMTLMLSCILTFAVQSQVTIGSLSEPSEGALLDFKEKEITASDSSNSTKGVLFPKVNLVSNLSLSPLFKAVTNTQKTEAKGMIVYNVNEKAAGIGIGLCIWNGEVWTDFGGGGSSGVAAGIKVDCSNIKVKGTFRKQMLITPAHTITLPVLVEKKGFYNIIAYSEPDNNYYFSASGEFLQPGNYAVVLTGMGTPREATSERGNKQDVIRLMINDVVFDPAVHCTAGTTAPLPTIKVEDKSTQYSFKCESVDISNVKMEVNEVCDGYLTAYLDAPAGSAGKPFHIETNKVNGVKFEASGKLSGGLQLVTLNSNRGTAQNKGIFAYEISSNSSDPADFNCTVDIPSLARDVNVFIYGRDNNDNWDLIGANQDRGVGLILQNAALFGFGRNAYSYSSVSAINISRSSKANFIPDFKNLDIVIISYDINPQAALVDSLIRFANRGGVVIHCFGSEDVNRMLKGIFGKEIVKLTKDAKAFTITGNNSLSDLVYDLQQKQLASDGGDNVVFQLPSEITPDVEVIAVGDLNRPFIIKHRKKPYVAIGDAGFFSGGKYELLKSQNDFHPLQVSWNGMPEVRQKTPGYTQDTYNAHFFVNLITWAINYRLSIVP
jgi:hypothetical protein